MAYVPQPASCRTCVEDGNGGLGFDESLWRDSLPLSSCGHQPTHSWRYFRLCLQPSCRQVATGYGGCEALLKGSDATWMTTGWDLPCDLPIRTGALVQGSSPVSIPGAALRDAGRRQQEPVDYCSQRSKIHAEYQRSSRNKRGKGVSGSFAYTSHEPSGRPRQ